MGAIADHIATLGYILPRINQVVPFQPVSRCGDIVFVSGQISRTNSAVIEGPIQHLSSEQIREAVRVALLRGLAALDAGLPKQLTVRQVLKLTGYVSTNSSALDPAVLNSASELLIELYGTSGNHARTVVGVSATPYNAAITIDLIVAI